MHSGAHPDGGALSVGAVARLLQLLVEALAAIFGVPGVVSNDPISIAS